MTAPAILALDLATRTGWAFATADAVASWPVGAIFANNPPVISSGIEQLRGSQTQKFGHMMAWIGIMLRDFKPGQVWIEGVIANPGAPKSFRDQKRRSGINMAAQMAHALNGIVKATCIGFDIPVHTRMPGTIKQSLTGNGRATKHQMIAMCELRGWHPSDDNEADAMALLDLAAVHWRTHSNRRAS